MKRLTLIALLLALAPAWGKYLVPMDSAQTDHLKAYGVAYRVLEQGYDCEWLLNYRGGSWLLPEAPGLVE
ncbi:asparagine synthetase B, partial [bacterium]|nr:asparagine synthetase B [bacterium]